ncbi:MAG TPA: hypothetical protein VH815_02125 [Acidobacteriota bacterium]
MTPELKTACELVFQEHKLSAQPIKWSRDVFRGRITIGLSELAKETLVKKNIILWPDKSKKIFTTLNPDVATARSFEEAEKMIETKKPALTAMAVIEGDFNVADLAAEIDIPKTAVASSISNPTPIPPSSPSTRSYSMMKIVPASEPTETTLLQVSGEKWWMKPLYLYFIWPVCGAVVGVLISMLMNLAYHELFAK